MARPNSPQLDDVDLALATLRAVCLADDSSHASRQAASRTLLEYYGYLGTGRTQVPDLASKSHAELSMTELKRRAAELRSEAQKHAPNGVDIDPLSDS